MTTSLLYELEYTNTNFTNCFSQTLPHISSLFQPSGHTSRFLFTQFQWYVNLGKLLHSELHAIFHLSACPSSAYTYERRSLMSSKWSVPQVYALHEVLSICCKMTISAFPHLSPYRFAPGFIKNSPFVAGFTRSLT